MSSAAYDGPGGGSIPPVGTMLAVGASTTGKARHDDGNKLYHICE